MLFAKLLAFGVLLVALACCTPIDPRGTPINSSDAGVTLTLGVAWRTVAGAYGLCTLACLD
jgi:hypothetical protein